MKSKLFLLFFLTILNTYVKAQSPALVGYWHNWQDAVAPYIPLDQVDARYNVICVSFGVPQAGTNAQIVFTPDKVTQVTLISQIQTLQSQGKKVILSIGGATAPVAMLNMTDRTAFINSVTNLLNTYGFDGIDIDFEGSSLSISGGTIVNPIDQPVINLIAGLKQVMANFRTSKNRKMFLSMAPETAFVQGGMSAFGGIWGAYLPVIHAMRDSMDILQVQLYNSGTMYGINGGIYAQGTVDFIVSQTEAVIKGFNTNGGAFVGLPANKIAIGLPACSSAAGGGYTLPATVKAAMNYLRGTGVKPGAYTLAQAGGYPDLRGMMTWSINWDKVSTCGPVYEFAQNFQSIFSGVVTNTPPSVSITSPTNNASFAFPATVTINANATDADGTITKVEFYRGTTLLNTDNIAPYSFKWTNIAAGTYSLTAKAYDNLGAVKTSTAVSMVVKKTNIAPSVSITSPTNNATVATSSNLTINANATDTDGTITKVDFYRGTTLLNSDNTAPYSYVWSNVPAGTYNLTAKATDNSGSVVTSVIVKVIVATPVATADIIGPSCVTANSSAVYELSAANIVKLTTTNWWSSGSVPSIVPFAGQPGKVTVNFDQWFVGGDICVGANYSASPWYKSVCKTVGLCPTAKPASIVSTSKQSEVSPIPSSNTFNFIAGRNIQGAKVFDQLGIEKINLGVLQNNQSMTFGEQLPSGIYFLTIQYEDKTNELIKLIKTK